MWQTSNNETITKPNIKETNTNSDIDESDDVETNLRKLKKFFEENLITEDEYNKKRKEIIENM